MTQTTIRFKKGERPFLSKEPLALCDIASLVTETGQNRRSTYVSTENMVKDYQGVVFDNSEDLVNGIVYKPGDVLVSNIRPYLKKVWLADRCGVCSSDVLCIRPNNGVKSNYLFSLLARDSFITNMMRAAKGSKMPRGDKEFTMSFPVDYCTEEYEQEMIGTFFTELDNLIAASADEVAALEEAKKGMIQKIFSREIRFKRDDGMEYPEWKNLPLGDVVEPHNIVVDNPGNGYIKLAVRSHCKGTFHKTISSEEDGLDVDKMYLVKANHLIVNITFAWEHAIAITKPEDEGTYVSHRFPQYQFVRGNLPSFYEYVIKDPRMKYEMGLCSPGGAGRNRVLNQKDFLQISVVHPHIDEQRKIATFLSSLDDAIAAAKDELAGYRELKRGLLQQMFA